METSGTIGGSLAAMVTVAVSSSMVRPSASERTTLNVSSPSVSVSSAMAMVMVPAVTPAANARTPDAAV